MYIKLESITKKEKDVFQMYQGEYKNFKQLSKFLQAQTITSHSLKVEDFTDGEITL